MSFKGKTVLVTGASSGIGASTAILFAKEGANVGVVGRKEDKLDKVVAECKRQGGSALKLKYDVSVEDDARATVEDTINAFGTIDVLVNNAGIIRHATIESEEILKAFDEVINTNTRAVVHMTHLALPYLKKSQGNIINISSVAAHSLVGNPVYVSYGVSKAALDMFTKYSAMEFAPFGVRVNSINPGPVLTDIHENSGAQTSGVGDIAAAMPLKRQSDPKEIAELIMYVASDKSVGMTGSILVSDNGFLLSH